MTATEFWVAISEIVRNIGLVVGGAIGIYLAWKRVIASSKQADAQLRQAELSRRDHVGSSRGATTSRNSSIARSAS